LPPAFEMDKTDLVFNAEDKTYKKDTVVYIKNSGASELNWNIDLAFHRALAETNAVQTSSQTYAVPSNELFVLENTSKQTTKLTPKDEVYNRVLEYDTENELYNWLGFGTFTAFKSATRFVAPADGFSLSHIKTWYRCESAINGKLLVEIRAGGSNINNAPVVAKGELAYTAIEQDFVGQFYTIPLNETKYIYPGEDIYVIITYPLGVSNPQGTYQISSLNVKPNQHFYQYDGQWYDLGLDGNFRIFGYMVKALEKELEIKNWLKLDVQEGKTSAGDSSAVKLSIDAVFAQELDNFADLTIHTNDNNNLVVPATVSLLLNKAPKVSIKGDVSLYVLENSTLEVTFVATDLEKDAITLSLLENHPFVTSTITGNELKIVLQPTNDHNGVYTFSVKATDQHNASATTVYQIEVIDINRAPMAKQIAKQYLGYLNPVFEIPLSDIVYDLDGETLKYSYSVEQEEIIEVFISGKTLMVRNFKPGETTLTITGTDTYGLAASSSIVFNVESALSVEDIQNANWSIYPNPTVDFVNLSVAQLSSEELSVKVINILGETVHSQIIPQFSNEVKISMKEFEAGVYMIELNSSKGKTLKQIIKN